MGSVEGSEESRIPEAEEVPGAQDHVVVKGEVEEPSGVGEDPGYLTVLPACKETPTFAHSGDIHFYAPAPAIAGLFPPFLGG